MSATLTDIMGPQAIRAFHLERTCQENQGHTHHYNHVTVVTDGAIQVFFRKPGATEELVGPVIRHSDSRPYLLILANVEHRIKAVAPHTRYLCIYAHYDHEGVPVQEYAGVEAAYV